MVAQTTRCRNEKFYTAVALQLDSREATLQQCDQIVQKMGFRPGGRGAPGSLFHWVTKRDNGIRVTDMGESREQFQRFSQEGIQPYTAEVGITSPPQITFFEVHNYVTKGGDSP